MKSHVSVLAGTRADLTPLGPVIASLQDCGRTDVSLLAGSGAAPDGSRALIDDLGLSGVEVTVLDGDLGAATAQGQAASGLALARSVTRSVEATRAQAFVVLGDRWELLYAVPSVVLQGIPVVHLHGGEVTEGAIDDRVRHAVTKLSDLHCVSTEDARDRVLQLGEPEDRVFVTGAPGLDRVRDVRPMTDDELSSLLGIPVRRPLALVTYHPVTVGDDDPGSSAAALLETIAAQAGTMLVTHPGMDVGRDAVLKAIEAVAASHDHVVSVPTLGRAYLSVLATSDLVAGNSSSGIIEAASFQVPVVNVGDRQHGRPTSCNVITCRTDRDSIAAAVRRALTPKFRAEAATTVNVYGDGHSAPRVAKVVDLAVRGNWARKPFVDLSPGQEQP